jgi:hypothetical protein
MIFIRLIIISVLVFGSSNLLFSQIKVSQYDLDFQFDFENERLSCIAKLGINGQGDTLNLLLYRLLKVISITDTSGRNVDFTQNVVSFKDFEKLQVNHIKIPVRELAQTKSTLTINYEGTIVGYTETGMNYVKDHISSEFTIIRMDAFAYPVQGTPSVQELRRLGMQMFDYVISATVPDSLKVVALGKLVETEQKTGTVKYKYQSIVPSWRIDLAIGKYCTLSFDNFKIHYFKEDSLGAQRVYSAIQQTKLLYDSWFGQKKLKDFTVIEVLEGYGSQTDACGIIQTSTAFKNPEYIEELYHEVSHLWNVPHKDKAPCRLESEGLAMFMQFLVKEKMEDDNYLEKMAQITLEKVKKQIEDNSNLARTPIIEYGEKNMTDYSYSKGMLFFYTLYHTVGEKAFFEAIKGYYNEFKDTGSTTKEFAEYLKSRFKNSSVDRLINDWIFTNQSSILLLNSKVKEDLWK